MAVSQTPQTLANSRYGPQTQPCCDMGRHRSARSKVLRARVIFFWNTRNAQYSSQMRGIFCRSRRASSKSSIVSWKRRSVRQMCSLTNVLTFISRCPLQNRYMCAIIIAQVIVGRQRLRCRQVRFCRLPGAGALLTFGKHLAFLVIEKARSDSKRSDLVCEKQLLGLRPARPLADSPATDRHHRRLPPFPRRAHNRPAGARGANENPPSGHREQGVAAIQARKHLCKVVKPA